KHNTTYYYRVKAQNEVGASEYSYTSATTLNVAPAAPSAFTAVDVTASKIKLEWQDNADNEEGYTLERRSSASDAYDSVAELPANTITFDEIDLQPNTTYSYRLSAYNAIGNSEYATINATTLNVTPASPSELNASSTASSITLTWTDNADNETDYIVEWSSSGEEGSYT